MTTIKILLVGEQGSGKSILIRAIKAWLDELDIEVVDGGDHDCAVHLTEDDKRFLATGE